MKKTMIKQKKLLKKRKLWTVSLMILVLLLLFFMNTYVVVSRYKIPYDKELTVLQLSDIHHMKLSNRTFKLIEDIDPDVILITGDFIDRRKFDLERSMEWIHRLDYPTYYVTGNHEFGSRKTDQVIDALEKSGVKVLRNETAAFGDFNIVGYDDPLFANNQAVEIDEGFNILMYHRPESFEYFDHIGIDLMLCGHAHGGQIRLFGQGLFSPGEGYLPKYTSGMHEFGNMSAVISRGLGNSLFPFRIFNQPELVVIQIGPEN